jgi:hypothetical protein
MSGFNVPRYAAGFRKMGVRILNARFAISNSYWTQYKSKSTITLNSAAIHLPKNLPPRRVFFPLRKMRSGKSHRDRTILEIIQKR